MSYKYLLRRGWYWQCVCTSIQLFRVWCGFQFNLHRFYRSQTVFLNQKEASSRNIPSFYHRGIFQVKESKLKNGKSLEFKKKEKKKLKNECEFLIVENNSLYKNANFQMTTSTETLELYFISISHALRLFVQAEP